uniref:Uncharacterized protein n=1 Tax=Oryza barthii TaxID=65489 RepID=A0A0D3FKS6_9ORYZ
MHLGMLWVLIWVSICDLDRADSN